MRTSVASQYNTNHNVTVIVWIGDNIVNHIFVARLYGGILSNPIFLICRVVRFCDVARGCKAVRMSLAPFQKVRTLVSADSKAYTCCMPLE
jgi:hypothetical protein